MKQTSPEILKRVHKIFREKGLSLAVAESCTGGLISHYLTAIPGASDFFIAGIIAYSKQIKTRIIGVSSETIQKHGVVSDQIAREMAEKIRLLAGTDYSVSTTGNLGPDVLEGKEKGLIYIAASKEGKTISQELRLQGDREENKKEASLSALRLLVELVKES
jgi:PncC family amidohydrolase